MESVLVTLRQYPSNKEVDIELPIDVRLSELIPYVWERLKSRDLATFDPLPASYLTQKLDQTRNPVLDINKSLLENEQAAKERYESVWPHWRVPWADLEGCHPLHPLSVCDGDTLVVVSASQQRPSLVQHNPSPPVNQAMLQCIWTGQHFPLAFDSKGGALMTTVGLDPEAITRTDVMIDAAFTSRHQARIERSGINGTWVIYDGWMPGEVSDFGTYVKRALPLDSPTSASFPVEADGIVVQSAAPTKLRSGDFICFGERVRRGPVLRFFEPR